MSVADGFVHEAVKGAAGAVVRSGEPFLTWLRDACLMLPVYLLAVLVALRAGRRLVRGALVGTGRVLAAAMLVVVAGSVVGSGEMLASAMVDYRIQAADTAVMYSVHARPDAAGHAADEACTGTCARVLRLSWATDLRAARFGARADLAANVVVVCWGLAMCGGRLDAAPRRRERRPSASAHRRPVGG